MSRAARLALVVAALGFLVAPPSSRASPQPPPPDPGPRVRGDSARTADETATGAGTETDAKLDHDLERIRRGLARGELLNWELPKDRPVFRVEVEAELPDISTWLGDPRALRGGPFVFPSYHAEFLRMVTPAEATASFTNGELAQVLATGVAGGLALQGIIGAVKGAIAGARRRAACEEVRESLQQLNMERAAAGLSPVPVPEC
jgi:hypothetical protein